MLGVVRGGRGTSRMYVLSPLLLNTFFAAIVIVETERFSDDAHVFYSQVLPISKSIDRRLALKRHWNVRGVRFGGCCNAGKICW